MTQLSVDEIPTQLPSLVLNLAPGDEIVLVNGGQPVARVTPMPVEAVPFQRRRGTAKGVLTIISEDDDHLADFAEYM